MACHRRRRADSGPSEIRLGLSRRSGAAGAAAMDWDEPPDEDWDFDQACEEQFSEEVAT